MLHRLLNCFHTRCSRIVAHRATCRHQVPSGVKGNVTLPYRYGLDLPFPLRRQQQQQSQPQPHHLQRAASEPRPLPPGAARAAPPLAAPGAAAGRGAVGQEGEEVQGDGDGGGGDSAALDEGAARLVHTKLFVMDSLHARLLCTAPQGATLARIFEVLYRAVPSGVR